MPNIRFIMKEVKYVPYAPFKSGFNKYAPIPIYIAEK